LVQLSMAQRNQNFSFRVFDYAYSDLKRFHFLVDTGASETVFLFMPQKVRWSVGTMNMLNTPRRHEVHEVHEESKIKTSCPSCLRGDLFKVVLPLLSPIFRIDLHVIIRKVTG
jgi:hypothetical protein